MEKTDVMTGIDQAIRAEAEAMAFYGAAAEKTQDAGGAAMFRELASFEASHKEHLEALKASMAAGRGGIPYPGRPLAKVFREGGTVSKGGLDHSDALDALRLAIGAEQRAEIDYRALAEAAPDRAGQEMFRRLAEEEAMHRRLLDDQYYSLTNQGVWQWGD